MWLHKRENGNQPSATLSASEKLRGNRPLIRGRAPGYLRRNQNFHDPPGAGSTRRAVAAPKGRGTEEDAFGT